MPRTYKQNKELKDLRRKEILDKSLIIFSNVGIKGVTMDQIAKFVGCSHGLLYHYFSNKEDLFNEHKKLCQSLIEGKITECTLLYNKDESLLEAVNELFINLIFSDNKTDCYYLYLYTLVCLYGLTSSKQLFAQNKELENHFKDTFKTFLINHPTLTKAQLKERIKCYFIFISGLATNYIKYPGLFVKKIDHRIIYNTFFSIE